MYILELEEQIEKLVFELGNIREEEYFAETGQDWANLARKRRIVRESLRILEAERALLELREKESAERNFANDPYPYEEWDVG